MDKVIVLVDSGFLSKLSKYFGEGKYLKYDLVKFSKQVSRKQDLICEHIFYYTAPPFQTEKPSVEESRKYKNYRKFVSKLFKNSKITIREGRCQRLKFDGGFVYKQKGVDSLMIMDMMRIPIEYKNIKKIILIASDSDFVPTIEYLKKLGIEVILYTYFDRKRESNFSTSNDLLKSCSRWIKIKKEDFENAK
jgi:uncharacterized LabA/DUF88 family protein